MRETLEQEELEAIAKTFRILGEPTRLAILQALKPTERSVGELVEAISAKQANVSKQLGILHDAGLVDKRRRGNFIFYSICEPLIFQLCELVCNKVRSESLEEVPLETD